MSVLRARDTGSGSQGRRIEILAMADTRTGLDGDPRERARRPVTLQSARDRRSRQRTDAQRAILDATEAILVEEGYEQFSMRKLASRCGYTAPTIYHHFGDKTGLIDALLEEVFRELVAILEAVKPAADPLDRMRAQFVAFVDFALRNPTHYRLLTTPRDEDAEPPPSGERAIAILEEPLRVLDESGLLKSDEIEAVQQSFWALMHGLISLQTSRPDYDWSDRLIETSLEAMIEGLIDSESDSRSSHLSRVPDAEEKRA